MKILVVDDQNTTRKIVTSILEDLGHEVVAEESGEAAWERFQKERFRMVLTDWVMPGMSGVEFIEKIRKSENHQHRAYIILLTGREERGDLIEGLNAGADDYITKPFHIDELSVRVRAGTRIVELQKKLEDLAVTDPLTGLTNRRGMKASVQELLQIPSEKPVGFILADIDHFKDVNDNYGHGAGDVVLEGVARRLRDSFRTTDTVSRVGGEEFLVVAVDVNPVQMYRLTNRVRQSLGAERYVIADGQEIGITCSFGVTYAMPGPELDMDSCIARADRALYESKFNGRNRVTVHHPGMNPSD